MALQPGRIDVGSEMQFTVAFTDQNDVPTDPTTVVFRSRSPSGVESTYTFGSSDEIQNPSTGNYTATITLDEAGKWELRWQATGPTFALKEIAYVQTSDFNEYQPAMPDYSP